MDNGVVVIGGIFTIDKEASTEGLPLLRKIPLLGWLFKNETKSDVRKDLLIFISPKIIKDEVHRLSSGLAEFKKVKYIKIREEEFEKTSTKKIKRYLFTIKSELVGGKSGKGRL